MRRIVQHLLWETGGMPRTRALAAVIISAILTWLEWVKHHPPEIALIAVIHFVFVLAAIGVLLQIRRWLPPRRGAG